MRWRDLIARTATRADVPKAVVQRVLNAFVEETLEALSQGEEVTLRGIGTLGSRWREMRSLRSIQSRRKMMLDGRYIPRFRAATRLRGVLAARTPQNWRSPQHQAAWRVAEALVSDLNLYHADRAPALAPDADCDAVDAACLTSFGPLWSRVVNTYERDVAADVRADTAYLQLAAQRRWTREAL